MKVIHLISGGDTGGAKTHIHTILRELNRHITADMICFTETDFTREAVELGIPTEVIQEKNFFKTLKILRRKITGGGYDIIHCHGSRGNLMGALLKRHFNIPVISTVHSDYKLDYLGRPLAGLTYGKLNALALRRMDYRIGVSDSMRQLLIERGFKPNSLFSIYNGIDFTPRVAAQGREEFLRGIGLQYDSDSVIAGIAARLDPVKDVATMVRGFAEAYRQNPKLRLVVAGAGQEMEMLRGLAAELGAGDAVCFAGWITDIDSFYNAIDINCLTSLSETFPYAITEGARAGLPAVSSRVGGVPYIIRNGVTGFLFEPEDFHTLADRLLHLSLDEKLRREMGQALYAKGAADFSVEASLNRQLEIYRRVLARYGRRKGRDGVLICGAYGQSNAGDDAVLEAIVREMNQLEPGMPITVLSRSPRETMRKYGVDAIYTFNMPRFHGKMKKTRLYLNGGGSLIQDVTSRRSLLYYLYSIRAAKKRGNKVIMYGCGIGPVNYDNDLRMVKKVLNKYVDTITLREEHSFHELHRFGVTEPEIIVSSDPALTLPPAPPGEIDQCLRDNGIDPEGKYICFALRMWPGFDEKADCFTQAANTAYERHGLIPVFVSINHRDDGQAADLAAGGLLCPFHILREPMESGLTIGIMSRMSVVVSMRLHGLIFAAGQGVPLVGVSYDPKVSAFLDRIEHPLYTRLEDLSVPVLLELLEKAVDYSQDKGLIQEHTDKLIEIESRNLEAAKRLLESSNR